MRSHPDLVRRLEFLGISDADACRLRALGPLLAEASEAIVAGFYRHLLLFPETRRLLKDPQIAGQLLEAQRAYLCGLASVPLDGDDLEERRQLGQIHEAAGVPPEWYVGASAHYFSQLAFVLEDATHGDVGELRLLLVAVLRRLLLDAQLGIEAYVAKSAQIDPAGDPVRIRDRIDRILRQARALEQKGLDEAKARECGRVIREECAHLAELVPARREREPAGRRNGSGQV